VSQVTTVGPDEIVHVEHPIFFEKVRDKLEENRINRRDLGAERCLKLLKERGCE